MSEMFPRSGYPGGWGIGTVSFLSMAEAIVWNVKIESATQEVNCEVKEVYCSSGTVMRSSWVAGCELDGCSLKMQKLTCDEVTWCYAGCCILALLILIRGESISSANPPYVGGMYGRRCMYLESAPTRDWSGYGWLTPEPRRVGFVL